MAKFLVREDAPRDQQLVQAMAIEHYKLVSKKGFLLFLDLKSRERDSHPALMAAIEELGSVKYLSNHCYLLLSDLPTIEQLQELDPLLGDNDLVVCVPLRAKDLVHFFTKERLPAPSGDRD